MADDEGNEAGKCGPRWHVGIAGMGRGRCLRVARIIGGRDRDEILPALRGRVVDVAMKGVDSRIIEVCHDDLKMEGQAEFHRELKYVDEGRSLGCLGWSCGRHTGMVEREFDCVWLLRKSFNKRMTL
ncbi:hypothetical protein GOBAR_AA35036 [Gossypium barbadense]|uniref:Uncharacterized protein n=1 Tax=Gossypium barbadense TaxID=3634 RepID=A0A2P5W3N5_GOSBA|nr:hypothetical protein GOBAR_AA35036 [Gossypium barbadense]